MQYASVNAGAATMLKMLIASDCKRLQYLPDIPSCLEELDAPVLQKLSKHSFEEEDDPSIELWFDNCFKLDAESNKKNLADSQLRIRHWQLHH